MVPSEPTLGPAEGTLGANASWLLPPHSWRPNREVERSRAALAALRPSIRSPDRQLGVGTCRQPPKVECRLSVEAYRGPRSDSVMPLGGLMIFSLTSDFSHRLTNSEAGCCRSDGKIGRAH